MITLPLFMVALFFPSAAQTQESSALATYEIVEVAEIQIEDKAVDNRYPVGLEERLRTSIITYLQNAIGSAKVVDKAQTTLESRQLEPVGASRRVELTVVIEEFSYKGEFRTLNWGKALLIGFTAGTAALIKQCRMNTNADLQLKGVFRDSQTKREVVTLQHEETVLCYAEHCGGGRSYFAPIVTERAASGLAELIKAYWRNSSAPTTSSSKREL